MRGTPGWYGDASGGFFLKSLDEWNPRLAFLVFPRIASSSRIDRRDFGRFELQPQPISTLPIARQIRELQIKIASAFPHSPTSRNRRGINKTDWIRIDRELYDQCLDRRDYRRKPHGS